MSTLLSLPEIALPAAKAEARPVELAIIVLTFNEIANVSELIAKLDAALKGVAWEVIFVDDDSPDLTAAHLHAIARRDLRVRCLRRIGRRVLSSACVEGMLATGAPLLAVMDADMQHDEALLPQMLQLLREQPVDLIVGSRYVAGGDVADWAQGRRRISSLATAMSQRLLGLTLQDPMSGFFMLRRPAFEAAVYRLSSLGFKLLVDLLVSSPTPLRVRELPMRFRSRRHGESKLDHRVAWDYLMLLVDKTLGRYVPTRLVSFAAIGSIGVAVHLIVLKLAIGLLGLSFVAAQTLAVTVAMVGNFLMNNALTYRDQQLSGWRLLSGLLTFMLACGIGAAANVGVASYIHRGFSDWLLAGLAGVLVGTVWNYGATSYLVWARSKRG